METLLDLVDDAVARFGDRPALAIRREDGTSEGWTYRELDRRARAAAFRLRALGLNPGDRLLTWSHSTPELPATYLGAMQAGLVLVPLDLRLSTEAGERQWCGQSQPPVNPARRKPVTTYGQSRIRRQTRPVR